MFAYISAKNHNACFNKPGPAQKMVRQGDSLGKFFLKKRLTMPKKTEGGPFSLARYCMLRGKKGNTFFGSVPWANGYSCDMIPQNLTIVESFRKKSAD